MDYEGKKWENWSAPDESKWYSRKRRWDYSPDGSDNEKDDSDGETKPEAPPELAKEPVQQAQDFVNDGEGGQFEGASGAAANAEPPKQTEIHKCFMCVKEFVLATSTAFVYSDPPHEFAAAKDTALKKSLAKSDGKEEAVNIFEGRAVVAVCGLCCEKLPYHQNLCKEKKKTYTNGGKVTSFFATHARQSKGRKTASSHGTWVCEQHDKKIARKGGQITKPTAEIYMAMRSEVVKRAMDWVTEMGPEDHAFLWCFYGCRCGKYPTKSCSWYRCRRNVNQGDVAEGTTDLGKKEGQWRSGCCWAKWEWKPDGERRLIVIGTMDDDGEFLDYRFALAGNLSQEIENKMQFLKTARALYQLGGRDVTYKSLLSVISELNDSVSKKFQRGVREVREIRSCMPTAEQLNWDGIHPVCEHVALSFPNYGVSYHVTDLTHLVGTIPEIDEEEMDEFLDMSGAMLDIENVWPPGDGGKRQKSNILASKSFKAARTYLSGL